jgi:hypothetical protein
METLVILECQPFLFTSGKDGTIDYGTDLPLPVFLVPDWRMKPAMASGCRTGPTIYID